MRPRVQIRSGETEDGFLLFRYFTSERQIVLPQRATIFRNRTTQALGALACMILSFLTLPAKTAGTSGLPSETPSRFLLLEPQGNRTRAFVGLILAASALLTPSPKLG